MDICIVPVTVWQGAAGLIRFEDASLLRIWLEMGQEVLFDLSDKVRALHTYIHTYIQYLCWPESLHLS